MRIKPLIRQAFERAGYYIDYLNPGQNVIRDIRSIHTPSIIFDVGANEGQTVKTYRKAFPAATIYAFEPDERAFSKLKTTENVRAYQFGLGDTEQTATMHLMAESVGNSVLPIQTKLPDGAYGEWTEPADETSIHLTTLDAFCSREDIARIDLLKIDTQGFDLAVLKGASEMLGQKSIPLIFIEVEFIAIYEGQPLFEDILRFLSGYRYRLVDLYDKHRDKGSRLVWCDALFCVA